MNNLVSKFLLPEEFKDAHIMADQLAKIFEPKAVSLNDEQKIGIRTVGEGREGIARTISRVALTHEMCLPRNEDAKVMESALDYYDQLSLLYQKLAHLQEMIDDTRVALGIDIMGMGDRYSGYLQTARSANTSLDMAMKAIDEYNKRFGSRSGGEEITPDEPVVTP